LPEIYVVAAGSLLEIALHERQISFPVGRVEQYFLYPLTFKEFLAAVEAQEAVRAFDSIPLPAYAYNVLMDYFHQYVLIGGMPEIVDIYIKKKTLRL
jgi:predicted AAA+ superfamily ATPase